MQINKQLNYKKLSSSSKKRGFTLAEVLLVITIIGIIASYTVPSLLNSVQDKLYQTGFKKAYSNLSNIQMQMISDNGGSLKGVFADQDQLLTKFESYLIYAKKCTWGADYGFCWAADAEFLNGLLMSDYEQDSMGFILNDGSFLRLILDNTDCSNTNGTLGSICAKATIDINGFKGPNVVGKDIFWFWIRANDIKPFGSQGDWFSTNDPCTDGSTAALNYGESCSAKKLLQ